MELIILSLNARLVSNEDSLVPLVELKYRGNTIEPLQRGLTDTDVRHNQQLDLANLSIEFTHPISVSSRHMEQKKWKLLELNSGFETIVTSLHIQARMSPAKLKCFYPLHTIDCLPTERQQEALIDSCVQAGFHGIPIIDAADSTPAFLEYRLKKFSELIEGQGAIPIPSVAMPEKGKSELFEKKMQLVADYGAPMVFIPYRGLRSHRREYLFLREFAKTHDACIGIVNTKRESFGMATSHLLPFYGASLISLAMPWPFPHDSNDNEFSIATRKWLERDLTYPNLLRSLRQDPHFAAEDCRKFGLISPAELIDRQSNVQVVNSASRVFDVCMSNDEFSVLRKVEHEGKTNDYVASKPALERNLQALSQK